jgi:hypothetical protein
MANTNLENSISTKKGMDNILSAKLMIDVVSNVITTTAQFGDPELTVIAPFIASDIIYSGAIKDYVSINFGGNEGLTDEYTRDVVMKTALTGFLVWVSQVFTGQGVGLLEGTLNAFVSYTASNGIQDLVALQ